MNLSEKLEKEGQEFREYFGKRINKLSFMTRVYFEPGYLLRCALKIPRTERIRGTFIATSLGVEVCRLSIYTALAHQLYKNLS